MNNYNNMTDQNVSEWQNNNNYPLMTNDISLNGTNINDLTDYNKKTDSVSIDNKSLIKTMAKEIVNNLKENNIELFDNASMLSNKLIEDYDDILDIDTKSVKNESKQTDNYMNWIFDECFNIKDFIILFILYFLLSQDMIKDFFGKYFTSLNPKSDGAVDLTGVIIYGLILTTLFMIIRKIV